MNNIVLIGPPGAGKGTQAKILSQKYGYTHISTGDLIREEQNKNTSIGQLATKLIDNGNFLPDDIVIQLVKQKIIDTTNTNGFIFDGFPRTVDQAKTLDFFLNSRRSQINHVLFFELSDDVVKNRIIERALKEHRKDDDLTVLETRIHNYKTKTEPIKNYYKESKMFIGEKKLHTINGDASLDFVTKEIEAIII
jgi:adenylate kinase